LLEPLPHGDDTIIDIVVNCPADFALFFQTPRSVVEFNSMLPRIQRLMALAVEKE